MDPMAYVAFTDECGVVVLVVEVKIMSEVASHGVVEKTKNDVVTFGGDRGGCNYPKNHGISRQVVWRFRNPAFKTYTGLMIVI